MKIYKIIQDITFKKFSFLQKSLEKYVYINITLIKRLRIVYNKIHLIIYNNY